MKSRFALYLLSSFLALVSSNGLQNYHKNKSFLKNKLSPSRKQEIVTNNPQRGESFPKNEALRDESAWRNLGLCDSYYLDENYIEINCYQVYNSFYGTQEESYYRYYYIGTSIQGSGSSTWTNDFNINSIWSSLA